MFGAGNPLLGDKLMKGSYAVAGDRVMTLEGAINKSGILFIILLIGATMTWYQPAGSVNGWMMLGVFGGLIAALVTIFKKEWAPISAPIYAFLEGLFLGGISSIYASAYNGIVINAVALTFGVMAIMLFLYRTEIIKVTKKFQTGLMAATGGIAIVYFASFILSFFGINLSLIHGSGLFGIGFSLIVVAVAAFNLIMDFEFMYQGAQHELPDYFEWYSAFGLMVTLIWLYIEILRLLSKLQSRN